MTVLEPSAERSSFVSQLRQGIPTVLTVAVFAAVMVLGHHYDWKLPRFAALIGTDVPTVDDWCAAHAVPETVCVECRTELMPKDKVHGWCKKHGVHECPLCHPDVVQLPAAPQVTSADIERAQRVLASTERPENDRRCVKQLRRLQFASLAAVEKAGVQIDVASRSRMVESIAGNGEITYDQTRVARLSSRVPGTLWRVEKQIGNPVARNDVLALVDAVEVGRAKAEFLQAFAQVDLKARVYESVKSASSTLPARSVQEAENALREARIRLLGAQQAVVNLGLPVPAEGLQGLTDEQHARRMQFLGLPESIVPGLDPRTTTANLLPVRSPLEGVVVSCEAVAGEVVDANRLLFVVADTRTLWLTLNVRPEDALRVALGQPIRFRPDDRKSEVVGTIAWISTNVDEKTRTVKVRAALDNTDGRLRAGTFGPGTIVLREEETVVVPNESVHWEGCCHVVFVRDRRFLEEGAPKVFHVRKVVPGARDDKNTEIITGVLPGEVVAAKGSGVLRSELLKNDLGAG